jgi:hypothetical protein
MLWVADSINLSEYSTTSGAYIRSVPLQPGLGFLSPSELTFVGSTVWVPTGTRVYAISTASGAILGNLGAKGFGFNGSVNLATNGSEVWVTNPNADSVTEIAASTYRLITILKGKRFSFSAPGPIATLNRHVWVASVTQTAGGHPGGYVTELSE